MSQRTTGGLVFVAGLAACVAGLTWSAATPALPAADENDRRADPASQPAPAKVGSDLTEVTVLTDWPGYAPIEVENRVSEPLARLVRGSPGLRTVRTASEFGTSRLTLTFAGGVGPDLARQRVSERLTQAGTVLPPGASPRLAADTAGPVFWYKFEGREGPLEPFDLVGSHARLAEALGWVEGVAEVVAVGIGTPEYHVTVDPEKLVASRFTLSNLADALATADPRPPGGVLRVGKVERDAEVRVSREDRKPIANLVIGRRKEVPVYVRDVAEVELAVHRPARRGDGGAGGVVMAARGEDSAAVARRVGEKLRELERQLSPRVKLVTVEGRAAREKMWPGGTPGDLEVKILADNHALAEQCREEVEAALKGIKGGRLRPSPEKREYLSVEIDRERAARVSTLAEVQLAVEAALGGRVVAEVWDRWMLVPVRLRLAGADSGDEEWFGKQPVPGARANPDGDGGAKGATLGEVTQVRVVEGGTVSRRENGRALAIVSVDVEGRTVAEYVAEARQVVADRLRLPDGVEVAWELRAARKP